MLVSTSTSAAGIKRLSISSSLLLGNYERDSDRAGARLAIAKGNVAGGSERVERRHDRAIGLGVAERARYLGERCAGVLGDIRPYAPPFLERAAYDRDPLAFGDHLGRLLARAIVA